MKIWNFDDFQKRMKNVSGQNCFSKNKTALAYQIDFHV